MSFSWIACDPFRAFHLAPLSLSSMLSIKSVLAIGAHPDDVELGCGATLAKLIDRGVHVCAMVMSDGLVGLDGTADRCAETMKSFAMLGVTDIVQLRLPDTQLASHANEMIQAIEAQCARLSPDRVYTMFADDRHQDHRAVFNASIVACRSVPQILSYETPSSWPNFSPVIFERSGKFMEKKILALQLHKSQAARSYMRAQQIACNAQFRGHQVDQGPSEGFMPYKIVL